MISIIAAITRDCALGRGGDMIYHISADLKRFKQITMGSPIVMGRRTFESFPKGPLPGRENMVVSRTPEYAPQGVSVYDSLSAALSAAASAADEIFVIGGGQIYAQAMPLAHRLIITEIDAYAPDADTFFPEISADVWSPVSASEWMTDPRSGARFRYVTYSRCEGAPASHLSRE